jgi:DNA protecting protein DprA
MAHTIRLLEPSQEDYPKGLCRLAKPVSLFCRGNWRVPQEKAIALVGTRKPTRLGIRWTEDLVAAFARQGWAIVSGLAKGIDGAAHAGALRANTPTAAVLGCGVDVVYPRSHLALMQQVASSGAVLSEYAPGTPPLRGQFPKRNRIIAALSRAVVVVEAGLESGALHTAVYARRMGVPVLVPVPLAKGPTGLGLRQLLKSGAWGFESCEEAVERIVIGGARQGDGVVDGVIDSVLNKVGDRQLSLFEEVESASGWHGRSEMMGRREIPKSLVDLLSQPGGARLDMLQQNWASHEPAAKKEALTGECQKRLLEWELQKRIVRQPNGCFRLGTGF